MSASRCHCCMEATRSACWSACYQLRRASSRQHLKLMRKAPEQHHHSRPPNVAHPDGDRSTTALCRSLGQLIRVRLLALLVDTVQMIVGPKLCCGSRSFTAVGPKLTHVSHHQLRSSSCIARQVKHLRLALQGIHGQDEPGKPLTGRFSNTHVMLAVMVTIDGTR